MSNNNKEKEVSIISKDITSQNHSVEPPITIFNKLNLIAKGNFQQIIPLVVCEICYKDQNLIQCKICNNGFHKKCLNKAFLPEPFICMNCKKQFTEEEINMILNSTFHTQNNNIINGNNIYKETEQNKNNIKKKIQINTITSPTRIIELNNDNNIDFNNETKKGGNLINNIKNNLNNKQNNKKIIDNMNEIKINDNFDKSETKSIKKETKIKSKIDSDFGSPPIMNLKVVL